MEVMIMCDMKNMNFIDTFL